jgi:hypothetical protein
MVALLFSLAGQGSVFDARVPDPVPIERRIEAFPGGPLQRSPAWWLAS